MHQVAVQRGEAQLGPVRPADRPYLGPVRGAGNGLEQVFAARLADREFRRDAVEIFDARLRNQRARRHAMRDFGTGLPDGNPGRCAEENLYPGLRNALRRHSTRSTTCSAALSSASVHGAAVSGLSGTFAS